MSIDMSILKFISEHMQNPFLDMLMPLVSDLGYGGAIWVIFTILLLISKKHRRTGVVLLLSILLGYIFCELVLKNIFQRPRPFMAAPYLQLIVDKPGSFSFPSGHTTIAFAFLGGILKTVKDLKVILPVAVLAFAITFSRMYLLVHYPTDILGGAVLGLVCSYMAYKIYIIQEIKWLKEKKVDM